MIRRDQNKIEIPRQDPCEIGAGGRILFFIFFPCMYMTICVHAMLNFFPAFSGNFYSIFLQTTGRYAVNPFNFSIFRPTMALICTSGSRTSSGLCDSTSQIYSHDQYCTCMNC